MDKASLGLLKAVQSGGQSGQMQSFRYLEGLWQLGTTRVPRVHGDEGHDGGLEGDLIVLKHKTLLAGSDGVQHCLVLGGADRQHSHRDAVELIETTPSAGLSQSLVDASHGL